MAEVQLSDYDVDQAVLDEPGVPLGDLIGQADAAPTLVSTLGGPLPEAGWRVLPDVMSHLDGVRVLAAPQPGVPGSWILLSARRREAGWVTVRHGMFHPVRPGRRDRRGPLLLEWGLLFLEGGEWRHPHEHGRPPVLLHNPGTQTWFADGQDSDLTFVDVLDSGGRRLELPAGAGGCAMHVERLPDLAAGASLPLNPFARYPWWSLPDGDYLLEARLPDLGCTARRALSLPLPKQ